MRRANIVRDLATEVLRIGSMLCIGLLLTPILFRELGESDFGLWKFLLAILLYALIAEPAFRGAMARFLAEAIGRNDTKAASRIVATTLLVLVPVMALASAALIVAAPSIVATTTDVSDPVFSEGVAALRVLAVSILLSTAVGFMASVLFAMKRLDLANVWVIPMLWLRAVSLGGIALAGGGILALAWATLAVAAVSFVVQLWFLLWVVRGRAIFERRYMWPGAIRGFWRYIGFAGIAKAGDVIRLQTTLILIAAAGSLEAAALYALVMTLQVLATNGLVGIIDSAGARLAAVASKPVDLTGKLASLAVLLGSLAALFGVGFFLTGASFIRVWADPADPTNILEPFVQLLAVSILMGAGRLLVVSSFRAQGRMEYLAAGQLVEGVLSAGLGYVLLSSMGIMGPLVAQVGVSAVYLLIAVPLLMHKASLITHRTYFWACYGRPLFAAVLGAIPLAITVRLVSIETWPVLIAAIGGGGGVMAGVMYFVGFPQSIRGEILVRVKDIRGR